MTMMIYFIYTTISQHPIHPAKGKNMPIQKILVYLGATMPADSSYTNAVKLLGEKIAKSGKTLVFGGSKEGTMTVLADAVLHNGGQVIGVFTKALPMEFLYPGLTQTIITDDLVERKIEMYRQADAIIAMPGSFGTWDELFDALERIKIAKIQNQPVKPIAILNLHGYYEGINNLLQRSIQEGYTTSPYANLLYSANTTEDLFGWLDSLDTIE